VPDRANANAAALVRDSSAEVGTLIAIGTEETQLHEFAGAQVFLQFGKEFRRETATSNLEAGFEFLAKTAQLGLLRAREWEFVHTLANDANPREWKGVYPGFRDCPEL
jgi:hypothetical protein